MNRRMISGVRRSGQTGVKMEELEELRKKEKEAVIRQLNPHFIFNLLGAVRITIKTDPEKAYNGIYDFSRYLRAVLRSLESDGNVPFREEVSDVCSFINLERLRFGDRIRFCMDIREEGFMLPPLSVMLLVDNALIHGMRRGERRGTITVRSYRMPSEYIVQVEDDGTGFDAQAYDDLPGSNGPEAGGLLNARYRVETMVNGQMDIQSFAGVGTVVTLHIPISDRKA